MRKIAGIDFTNKEVKELENKYFNSNDKYIIKYNTIYQLRYSKNIGLYSLEIYTNYKSKLPLIKRGRFIVTNAKHINDLLEFELLKEEF